MFGLGYINNIIFITKEFLFVCKRHIKVNFDPYQNDSYFCFRGTKGTLFEGGTRGAGFVSGGRLAHRWVQAHRPLRRLA